MTALEAFIASLIHPHRWNHSNILRNLLSSREREIVTLMMFNLATLFVPMEVVESLQNQNQVFLVAEQPDGEFKQKQTMSLDAVPFDPNEEEDDDDEVDDEDIDFSDHKIENLSLSHDSANIVMTEVVSSSVSSSSASSEHLDTQDQAQEQQQHDENAIHQAVAASVADVYFVGEHFHIFPDLLPFNPVNQADLVDPSEIVQQHAFHEAEEERKQQQQQQQQQHQQNEQNNKQTQNELDQQHQLNEKAIQDVVMMDLPTLPPQLPQEHPDVAAEDHSAQNHPISDLFQESDELVFSGLMVDDDVDTHFGFGSHPADVLSSEPSRHPPLPPSSMLPDNQQLAEISAGSEATNNTIPPHLPPSSVVEIQSLDAQQHFFIHE